MKNDFQECKTQEKNSIEEKLDLITKTGRGLLSKALAMELKGEIASVIQENEKTISVLETKIKESEALFNESEEDNKQQREKVKQLSDENKLFSDENKQLFDENKSLKNKCESLSAHFNKVQDEKPDLITINISNSIVEKFPDEIKEYFKTLLWASADRAKGKLDKDSQTRQFQVLEAFLDENKDFAPEHSEAEKRAQEIKQALKLDKTEKRLKALEKCGFTIVQDLHCHYKIRYYDDNSLQFAISSTPSEKRGQKNIEHEIINKCLLIPKK